MQLIKLEREPNINPKLKAFPYQDQAVKTVCDLEYAAILHEQGLGKSKIAIDIILYWLEKKHVDTVLLIVKKNLVYNWLKELKAHSFVRPQLLTQNKNANHYVFNSPCRLVLTHYEAIKTEQNRIHLFLKTRSVAVILDESTKIKNPNASLTKIFIELSPFFKKRIIMTGLPVANRPYDIWSQIYFLDNGRSLGKSFNDFKSISDLSNDLLDSKSKQEKLQKNLSSVFKKIQHFSVLETKNTGIIILPDKVFRNIITTWESKQLDLYLQVKNGLKAIIVKEGLPKEDNNEDILKRLLRLVQIASNPKIIDDNYNYEPGKYAYLLELVEEICNKKEKSIIWSNFTENVDELTKYLRIFGACKVHGKLSMPERNRAIEKFLNDSESKVLIATPGAAKEGLTLTVANHAIFYDRSFSLDDYLQSQDRIHRISQTKTCYVYNLIMEDSIDQWVDSLLRAK